ncbi:MAG TPA: 7TM diverse intracellular signaling domain-containing protein [Edaphocola sp.]|nr:7TM diverse intracellular signaling domain-containing protein [Edaphocola sp.]
MSFIILLLSACYNHNQDYDQTDKCLLFAHCKNGTAVIEGPIAFYWNQLLEPSDFKNGDEPAISAWVDFPETWNHFELNGEKKSGRGFTTYRTWFEVDSVAPMAIKIDDYCNTLKLWINGALIAEAGKIGTDEATNKAVKINIFERFTPVKGLNEVVFQTANFEEQYGGFRQPFLFGNEAKVYAIVTRHKVVDAFVLGIIFMVALYHFALFWMNKQRKAFLWFGLLAFFIGLRLSLLSSNNIFGLWLNEHAHLFLRISFLTAVIVPMLLFFFFNSAFPEYLSKRIRNVYSGFTIFSVFLIFLLPVYDVSVSIHYFQFFIIVGLGYILLLVIRSFFFVSLNKKIIGVGILFLLLSTVFEVLVFNRVVYADYVIHYGLVGFIFFQSYALSSDFSQTFRKNEELTIALDEHNKNLQKEVEIKSREALEAKQRELVSIVLQNSRSNQLLKKIEERLLDLKEQHLEKNGKSFSAVLDLVKSSFDFRKNNEYLLHFEKVHPLFFDNLLRTHPSLTQRELRLCAFLKMNLGHQEIAFFLHIEAESVRKAITRMRKKMKLDFNHDIFRYLTLFTSN